MRDALRALLVLACLLALSACKPREPAAAEPAASDAAASTAAPEVVAEPARAGFDLARVPLSQVALGDFPYIAFPGNCELSVPQPRELERAPFWIGERFEWAEGKTLASYVSGRDGASCGYRAFVRNLDSVVAQAGGVQLAQGKLTQAAWDELTASGVLNGPLESGLQSIQTNPITTWVIRRADRAIWIQAISSHTGDAGNFLLVETTPFVATASLLPASALKQQLDASGKVALQVHFATDQTTILPESKPQLEQVVQLLKADSALKLAVNGHTDASGDAAHNQQLSEGRAQAVVAALVAQGIAAARLSAKGFGDTQPVADNASDEGKARNRRVELVKQS